MKNSIRFALSMLVFVAQFATGGGLWTPSSVAIEPATTMSDREAPRTVADQDMTASIITALPVAQAQFAKQHRTIDKDAKA